MRLRLRVAPLDSRVASLGEVFAAALAVAGRSASGRITMPLPSAERASTSPGSPAGGSLRVAKKAQHVVAVTVQAGQQRGGRAELGPAALAGPRWRRVEPLALDDQRVVAVPDGREPRRRQRGLA